MTIGQDLDLILSGLQEQINQLSTTTPTTSPTPVPPTTGETLLAFTGFKNLKIVCRPNASTYEVNFDECILGDVNGVKIQHGASSHVLDVTVNGINGLDEGSLSSDNHGWYKIFIISDGTNTASILSKNDVPVLPNGYIYYAYAGPAQVYSASPVDLNQSIQYDSIVTAQDRGAMPSTGVAARAATAYQSLDLSAYVPSEAKFVSGFMGAKNGRRKMMAIATWPSEAGFNGDVGRKNAHGPSWTVSNGFDLFGNTDNFSDLAIENQELFWKSGDTQASNILYITGYRI